MAKTIKFKKDKFGNYISAKITIPLTVRVGSAGPNSISQKEAEEIINKEIDDIVSSGDSSFVLDAFANLSKTDIKIVE